jgi:Domain of unknown function (DUF4844)
MPRIGRIALNTLRLFAILAGAASATLWRMVRPAPDQQLEVSERILTSLNELRTETKYIEVPGSPYNGMRPEYRRKIADGQLNSLIDRLRNELASKPSKRFVLSEFKKTMAEFESIDTEDRERLLRYLQEIMTILGIGSSDGLLNRWMYGPLLGPVADRDYKETHGTDR